MYIIFLFQNNAENIEEAYKFNVIGNHFPTRKSVGAVSTTAFGHMPYCPKSPDYQQYVKWRFNNPREEIGNVAPSQTDDRMSFIENYVSKRLRQNHMSICNSGAVCPKDDFYPSLAYTECNSLKQALSWPTLSDMMDHGNDNMPWSMTDLTEAGGLDDGSNFDDEDEDEVVANDMADAENQTDRLLNFVNSVLLCIVQFWYCFTSNEKYKQEMKRRRPHDQSFGAVNSVSKIDKVSRIMFPLIFFILNVIYWSYYIHERSTEFHLGEINLNY